MSFEEFFKKHKSEFLLLVPLFLYIFLVWFFWGKWGNVVTDCFRETIIPTALLSGKALYSEITSIYPPLGYQLNALIVFIFKDSLNTFYWIGILSSFLILLSLYKTAKGHGSSLTALVIVLSVIEIFIFKAGPINSSSWIFPYSYSFLYAFLACVFAFYFYFEYKKTGEIKRLYSAFFAMGLSCAFKYDFLLFLILPVLEAIKNKSLKQFLKGAGLFAFPSVASFLIYFVSCGSTQKALDGISLWINFLKNFAKAPSVLIFNRNILQQTITPEILKYAALSLIIFAVCAVVLVSYLYFASYFLAKLKNKFSKILLFIPLFIFGFFMVLKTAALEYSNFELVLNFIFVPYFVTISAFIIFLVKFKTKNYTEKEKFYMTASIGALLIIYRQLAAVLISYIGNFLVVIPWFLFIYFWLEVLPENFEFFKKTRKAIALFFIVFGFSFLLLHINSSEEMNYKIENKKGVIYSSPRYAATINETVEYIKENIPKDKTMVVMSEGPILNYLTDRKTDFKYYALIPHTIEAFGEENVVLGLEKNPPDYIFITNEEYIFIGRFGIDYANKIMEFIDLNYNFVETLPQKSNSDFQISIYKKL